MNDRATQCSQLSPCNGTVMDQTGRGRHPTTRATSRNKYTKKDNRAILNCYYQSNPENIDYRKRMWESWKELERFQISLQAVRKTVRIFTDDIKIKFGISKCYSYPEESKEGRRRRNTNGRWDSYRRFG